VIGGRSNDKFDHKGLLPAARTREAAQTVEIGPNSDIRPDLHWLLFFWATQSYANDLILLGVEAVCATAQPRPTG
jgi:hypothetical protein